MNELSISATPALASTVEVVPHMHDRIYSSPEQLLASAAAWIFPDGVREVPHWDLIRAGLVAERQVSKDVATRVRAAAAQTKFVSLQVVASRSGAGLTAVLRCAAARLAGHIDLPVLWTDAAQPHRVMNETVQHDLRTFASRHGGVVLVADNCTTEVCAKLEGMWSEWATAGASRSCRVALVLGTRARREIFPANRGWIPIDDRPTNEDVDALCEVLCKIPFKPAKLAREDALQRAAVSIKAAPLEDRPPLAVLVLAAARGRYKVAAEWVRDAIFASRKRKCENYFSLLAFASCFSSVASAQEMHFDALTERILVEEVDLLVRNWDRQGRSTLRLVHPYFARLVLFAPENEEELQTFAGAPSTGDTFPSPTELLRRWRVVSGAMPDAFSGRHDDVLAVCKGVLTLRDAACADDVSRLARWLIKRGKVELFPEFAAHPSHDQGGLLPAYAKLSYARALYSAGRQADSFEVAKRAYKDGPTFFDMAHFYAVSLRRQGNHDAAEAILIELKAAHKGKNIDHNHLVEKELELVRRGVRSTTPEAPLQRDEEPGEGSDSGSDVVYDE